MKSPDTVNIPHEEKDHDWVKIRSNMFICSKCQITGYIQIWDGSHKIVTTNSCADVITSNVLNN
jgi:hypothetical protein